MNKDILKAVRDRIDQHRDKFDMNVLLSTPETPFNGVEALLDRLERGEHACGTMCCIAGETILEGASRGLVSRSQLMAIRHDGMDLGMDIAASLLGISSEAAYSLFYGEWSGKMLRHITVDEVLAEIDRRLS